MFLSVSCGEPGRQTVRPSKSTAYQSERSAYPLAANRSKVGTYPALAKSGGGYFYDDVLEYRVWVHRAEGGDDTYEAFAAFEAAAAYSQATAGAEEPLVLVRQRERIDEPKPNEFVHKKSERMTEWRVEWLDDGHRREPGSIARFLAEERGPTRR